MHSKHVRVTIDLGSSLCSQLAPTGAHSPPAVGVFIGAERFPTIWLPRSLAGSSDKLHALATSRRDAIHVAAALSANSGHGCFTSKWYQSSDNCYCDGESRASKS